MDPEATANFDTIADGQISEDLIPTGPLQGDVPTIAAEYNIVTGPLQESSSELD